MTEETRLDPGSEEARAAGCRCPILDNAHGRGYMGMEGIFVVSGGCPIHGEDRSLMLEAEIARLQAACDRWSEDELLRRQTCGQPI